jgi:hypothetical protein
MCDVVGCDAEIPINQPRRKIFPFRPAYQAQPGIRQPCSFGPTINVQCQHHTLMRRAPGVRLLG